MMACRICTLILGEVLYHTVSIGLVDKFSILLCVRVLLKTSFGPFFVLVMAICGRRRRAISVPRDWWLVGGCIVVHSH